ncbi:hypothetical protein GA0061078_0525 [Bifidobacterium bohemicum]|uniref:Putative peptidase A24A, prepilin type IV n=1 Tax=Bifidobacterium bohemicum DSM 22767 TaxID=1437606 RepID=A0A086ZJS1_9BIFI|nr:hypothetical protein [Bifidobacterium bohemicum]KFI46771.1 putative peptidase A24A, prepilin type IV [Bifidobacterium bohemicum DSM 22767]SCB81082.1 hypothetical protein GA0061078_0525 [Bifidobacterium bohemicum]
MPYLVLMPSLICGIALSVSDLHNREVPRAWVALGALVQFTVFAVNASTGGGIIALLAPLLYALAAFGIQLAMGKLQPGSLGLGDATASFIVGQAVGFAGFEAFLIWWMVMGPLGLIWIALWPHLVKRNTSAKVSRGTNAGDARHRNGKDDDSTNARTSPGPDGTQEDGTQRSNELVAKVPFVPVIVTAGIIAVAMNAAL